MEVLTHVNKRLKSRPLVQLPVEALLQQYQTTDSQFLHNFSIIYITMGFPRLSQDEQVKLAPFVLNCLEGKPENHQDKLLMLVLPLLESIEIPKDPEKRSSLLGLGDKPSTKKQFLAMLQDVLLLPYGVTSDGEVPAGMSSYAFKRVIANGWKAEELENLKKGICRFLCSGVFCDQDILTLLVLASADTRFSVATPAIAELSKINSSVDWSDAEKTAPLYTLFLGNGLKNAERKTSACSARVRQKLLQYLLKSRGKGINTVRGIQVIFEALFGENNNQKCKVLALQFAKNLIRDGPKDLIDKISKVILSGVSKLIGVESTEPADIQNAAYCAMAQLARKCPDIVNKDLQLTVAYFNHLTQAPTELHDSIREALIAVAPAFKWNSNADDASKCTSSARDFMPNSNQKLLLAMLSEHAESKSIIVQNVTCTFLTTCFPEHFVPARYLLLLIAGERSSLRETITQHLYGVSKKDHINYLYISTIDGVSRKENESLEVNQLSTEQRRVVLPSFKELINYVYEMNQKRLSNSSTQRHVYGRATLTYSYEVYTEILDYLRLCLWYSAGVRSNPNSSKFVAKLNAYIQKNYEANEENFLQKYLVLVKQILVAKRGNVELICIYDLLNAELQTMTQQCSDLQESFALALKDVSEYTRILVAQSIGILWAIGSSFDEFNAYIKEVLNSLSQRQIEHRHGSLLALSHALHRKIDSWQKSGTLDEKVTSNWAELKQVVILLIDHLADQQPLLVSAAINGISLIGSVIKLPLPDQSGDAAAGSSTSSTSTYNADEQMDVDGDANEYSKAFVAQKILFLLKSAHSRPKIREEAAHCIGHLAIGDGAYFTQGNLNAFTKMIKLTKDAALNIAIAQSIVLTVLGHEIHEGEEISDGKPNPYCDDKCFNEFLSSIIQMVADPNPASRHSTGIWLLALIKNCSKRPSIYKRKDILQYAFTELLSDDSEFVQDVASRGLGLVYELSEAQNQGDLANSLLNQLLGGKRQVTQVTEDTKLFEEGVLGKTPTGGNITTYKELCSLASDLNKPEMIYQFMQLANHNAAWNSKLGAAFGLKSISKGAKDQMKPFLEKIVPRLYRYKYDPTPKIQHSMISIWDSIVSDSKETVETYYWAIFDELVTNLTDVEWRVRIACCLAVRDLIKRSNGLKLRYHDRVISSVKAGGSETDNAKMDVDDAENSNHSLQLGNDEIQCSEPDLHKLWTQLFRVMDDVHEGTRLAAEGTAKQLSKICIVAASTNNGKAGEIVAATVMPVLLNVGITHTVAEIRSLSMKTLSELIDSSGSLLTPHLQILVPCLLKATGELEVPKLSYMSNQLGGNADAQEMVDSARAEVAKQHHSTETLTKCIRYINYESLEKMTPNIVELMKIAVNLGTKIACAHFVCLVTIRFQKEMQPLVGKYLSACFSGLKDRNNIVRKYYASAMGHLIGIAKEQSVIRLFTKLTEFYFENQSNKGIPQTISSVNKRHQEMLKDYSAHILPLIFFAMHEQVNDDNRTIIESWKELWIDVSPGDAGIRMNLESIMPMLEKSLEDSSWSIKAQGANAINTIATRLGKNLDHAERNRLINALLQAVSGRTFQGKERLLEALASLCDGLKKDDSQIHQQIIDAVMKECNKEEPIYRTHALKAIGDVLEHLQEDRFEDLYNMIWYLIDKKDLASVTGDDEEKNLSSDERNKRAMIFINLKETVCETLGKAWPAHSLETQQKYQLMFVERCVQCLQNNTRPVQLALLVALGKFVERLKILETSNKASVESAPDKKFKIDENEGILDKICKDILSAVVSVSGIPHTGLKKEALNILLTLSNRLIEKQSAHELAMLKRTFDEILVKLQRDNAPEIKIRLKDIEDKLKNV
ncbi:proteasome-associated protein ECM29 homolog isoform X2 [Sitodiplosis mosellana]|nr:proteasome-associated protein ECM29 homolog isoform X2 [Sitodiplosis mosellana]